ncbi:helix-turn-helix transcriptional regulator [Pedobacter sp. PLR]|uniref:helix-turn-helix domain-containing protein n=1 Tax=Pedobacter sp. PLR TaxID=2994465 RepID=UPI002246DEF6|nr:helix-turn-helix transcriptional regulator [Pedobacter sp. PLR]MCX2450442.1 helix-turn-helix transcriptional regulator [Pedobacter sp. PLR]
MNDQIEINVREIPSTIKKIRKIKSLTQEYLAAKLHISQNAYSKIELGHSKLTVERLCQIASILDVKPNQLLYFKPAEFVEALRASG